MLQGLIFLSSLILATVCSSPGAISHLLLHPNGKKGAHSSGHSLRSCSMASGSACPGTPIVIEGTNISLRLNKVSCSLILRSTECLESKSIGDSVATPLPSQKLIQEYRTY